MVNFKKALTQLRQGRKFTNENIEGVFNMIDGKKLSNLSAMWKVAVPIVPSFSNIPDGDYVADIKEMKLGESKAGKLQIVSTLEIADGEYAGKTVKRFDGVEEETNLGYFKNLCEVIGLDLPENAKQWQAALDEFVGNPDRVDLYDITTKTTKGKEGQEYSNVYINSISEFTKGGEGEEQVEGAEEEAVEEEQEVAEEETVEEEVVAEEEYEEAVEQEVVAPPKRTVKAVAAPVRKVAAAPVRRVAVSIAQPVRKIVVAPKATVQAVPGKRLVRK